MVGADRVDQALPQSLPEPFAVFALPDRWRTLVARVAVGDLFGGEREVMRTGLDGQRQSLRACPRDQRNGIGRRQVHDMDVAADTRGKDRS